MLMEIWLTSNGLKTCSHFKIPESSIHAGLTNSDSNNTIQLLCTCLLLKPNLLATKPIVAIRKRLGQQCEEGMTWSKEHTEPLYVRGDQCSSV